MCSNRVTVTWAGRPARSDCHVRATSQNPGEGGDAGSAARLLGRRPIEEADLEPAARFSEALAGAGSFPTLGEAGEQRRRRCNREARAPPAPSPPGSQSGPGLGGFRGSPLDLD